MATVEFLELTGEIKEDPRGLSFFPFRGRVREPQDFLQSFHLVSIRPGQTRGDHLHPGHQEWLYPFHGTGVLLWEPTPGELKERVISGDRTLIGIPPGVAHAVKNPGPEMLYLLAWREAVSPETTGPETLPRPLSAGLESN